MILLLAYDCVMQLLIPLCLKTVIYLRLDNEEQSKSGLLTLELLFLLCYKAN